MSKVKTAIRVSLLMLVLVLVACGCSNPTDITGKTQATIKIYPVMVELPIGETLLLKIQTASDGREDMDVEWVSSDYQIASVSEDGYVTAIAEGETVVEASLVKNKKQKSTCRVVVVEDGPILLFSVDEKEFENNGSNSTSESQGGSQTQSPPGIGTPQGDTVPPEPPDTPDDSQSEGEQEGTETDIPVEHNPEIDIPVEHDPRIDEFIWTIRVNDTVEKEIKDLGVPLKIIYKLKLNAVKKGGKTSKGTYKGTATLEMKIDDSELSKEIMEKSEGTIIKFLLNIGGTYNADNLSIQVESYNNKEYLDFGKRSANNPGDTITIVPLVPKDTNPEIVQLVPIFSMALGEVSFEGSGVFGASSLDIAGIGIDMDEQLGSSVASPYKMSILRGGRIHFQILNSGINGIFSGRLSKQPIVPK